MSRLNLLLLAALLGSCLLLVKTSYEWRRLFAELDRTRQEKSQLDAEYKRVDAERQARGTHLLVEKAAREKLQMRGATPAITVYVDDRAASGAAR